MKMKKILSLLTAVAMSSTLFASIASAVVPDNAAPKAAVAVTQWSDEDFAAATEGDPSYDGMGIFDVTFNATDIGAISSTTKLGKTSGTKIAVFEVQMLTDDLAASGLSLVDKSGTMGAESDYGNSGDAPNKGPVGKYVNGTTGCYPSSGSFDNATIDNALTMTVIAKIGTVVDLTGYVAYVTFTSNTPDEVKSADITFDNASITLGSVAPKVDYTALNDAITVAAGKVEADYTAESWATFAAAKTAANDALTSDDQAVVTAAAEALVDATTGLVAKPTAPVAEKDVAKKDTTKKMRGISGKVTPNAATVSDIFVEITTDDPAVTTKTVKFHAFSGLNIAGASAATFGLNITNVPDDIELQFGDITFAE